MNTLNDWIAQKQNLDSVSLIRITYDNTTSCYSKWRIDNIYVILFDNDFNVQKILWLNDKINVVDDNQISIEYDNNEILLEIFYGGAIL